MARSEQMDTSRKLLQRAQILLQTKGFNALSFQELADAIGIRKASVYHHFSTKQDLAVAAIRDYAQRFEEWARGVEGKSPTERLESYFEMLWSVTAK
jgi:TetR/AcrR family transcriptional repressor of nem operon